MGKIIEPPPSPSIFDKNSPIGIWLKNERKLKEIGCAHSITKLRAIEFTSQVTSTGSQLHGRARNLITYKNDNYLCTILIIFFKCGRGMIGNTQNYSF